MTDPRIAKLTGSRMPEDLKPMHDAVMASTPVKYRGYLLKPLSHAHHPHFDKGCFSYWGWNVCDPTGFIGMAPGAIWGHTVGDAKTIVDCMCEAGPLPVLTDSSLASPELIARHDQYRKEWNEQFWALIKERNWR